MESIPQVIRRLRALRDGGEVQNLVVIAYGTEGVSAGVYGKYDPDVAGQIWRRVADLEKDRGRDAERQPLDFREVSADEYRAIRIRAKRHWPHQNGVISELSARSVQGRLKGLAMLLRVRGQWAYIVVGDTPEAPRLLRDLADKLDRIATTQSGRRRQLIWLRPRSEDACRFATKPASLVNFFRE